MGTARWTQAMYHYAQRTLERDVLGGAGDQRKERSFRMCITLCRHRAVRTDELALVPQWWHDAPNVDIAGGPVEILWSRGLPDIPSAKPCEQPGHQPITPGRPDLWLPVDCTLCQPCLARKALDGVPVRGDEG